MKTFIALLLCLIGLEAAAQLPPILRNPFTTNSNPNGLIVVQTNGAYELQSTLPLSLPGGLSLGGTNGAGTNSPVKTNWMSQIESLNLVAVGTGVAMELANTNSINFFAPSLNDSQDPSTNWVIYTGFIDTDIDSSRPSRIVFNATKSGTAGNAVVGLAFNTSSTWGGTTTWTTTNTFTNAYSGSGTRLYTFYLTNNFLTLQAGTNVTILINRNGADSADTLVGGLIPRSVRLEYYRR